MVLYRFGKTEQKESVEFITVLGKIIIGIKGNFTTNQNTC